MRIPPTHGGRNPGVAMKTVGETSVSGRSGPATVIPPTRSGPLDAGTVLD
jgi:hypothetical protein